MAIVPTRLQELQWGIVDAEAAQKVEGRASTEGTDREHLLAYGRAMQSIATAWAQRPQGWEPIFSFADGEDEDTEYADAEDWAAGFLMAVWPHNVAIDGYLLSETLFGFLCALGLFLFSLAQGGRAGRQTVGPQAEIEKQAG